MDVATLAELLRETAEHHDHYEKTHPKHDWWDWYAPYLSARQNGSTPEKAAAAADRYMEEVLHSSRMTPFDYLLQRSQEEIMTTANTVSPTLREPTPREQIDGSAARIAGGKPVLPDLPEIPVP